MTPRKGVMPEKQQPNLSWILIFLYLGLATAVFYSGFSNDSATTKHVSYSEFLTAVQDNKLESVRVTNSDLIGTVKKADKSATPSSIATPRLPATDESLIMKELRDDHVQIIAEPQTTGWWSGIIAWVLPTAMFVFLYSLLTRSRTGQSGFSNVGKSRAKIYDQYTH